MSIGAMKQALEALEILARYENPETKIQVRKPKDGGPIVTMYPHKVATDAADAIRTAIEQAEKQEPSYYGLTNDHLWMSVSKEQYDKLKPAFRMACYTTPPAAQPAPVEEPLGYWNAVEGWVELPEETQKPVAWVYPEALEAFRQGKPWTAYGEDGSGPNSDGVERIPLYATPPAQPAQRPWVGLTDDEVLEIERYAITKRQATRSIEAKLKEKNHG